MLTLKNEIIFYIPKIRILLVSTFFVVGATGQHVRHDIASHRNWWLLDRGEDCGHRDNNRIIGGNRAFLGQHPWIARIGYAAIPQLNTHPVFYLCGGAIITERYVLTAAHCAPKYQELPDWIRIEIVTVRLGENDVMNDPDCMDGLCAPPVQDIGVEDYIYHSGYDKRNQFHDIGLIRLVKDIRFGRFVYPICLPVFQEFAHTSLDGLVMEVAGWGATELEHKMLSDVLMTLKVPIVNLENCQHQFENITVIITNQLCAGGIVGEDSCQGDSGGPLVAPFSVNSPPRFFLMGIVSYGDTNCSVTYKPGIYTNIASYLTWILDHVKPNMDSFNPHMIHRVLPFNNFIVRLPFL